MSEQKEHSTEQSSTQSGRADSGQVFYYKDAGIEENHGYVPRWLWVVVVVMAVWGIYYLYAYWSPAG
jgi:hypothetical protein